MNVKTEVMRLLVERLKHLPGKHDQRRHTGDSGGRGGGGGGGSSGGGGSTLKPPRPDDKPKPSDKDLEQEAKTLQREIDKESTSLNKQAERHMLAIGKHVQEAQKIERMQSQGIIQEAPESFRKRDEALKRTSADLRARREAIDAKRERVREIDDELESRANAAEDSSRRQRVGQEFPDVSGTTTISPRDAAGLLGIGAGGRPVRRAPESQEEAPRRGRITMTEIRQDGTRNEIEVSPQEALGLFREAEAERNPRRPPVSSSEAPARITANSRIGRRTQALIEEKFQQIPPHQRAEAKQRIDEVVESLNRYARAQQNARGQDRDKYRSAKRAVDSRVNEINRIINDYVY